MFSDRRAELPKPGASTGASAPIRVSRRTPESVGEPNVVLRPEGNPPDDFSVARHWLPLKREDQALTELY